MQVADRIGQTGELPDVAVEETLEVGAALALNRCQRGDVDAVELVGQIVEQALGASGSGRLRHRGQMFA